MAGYSGTSLQKKLGLKPGQSALLLNVPMELNEIREFSNFARIRKSLSNLSGRQFDYIHLFCKRRKDLEIKMARIQSLLNPNGMIWVSWPKKSSVVSSDITGNVLREVILPEGLLVDVKVCAVDATWSGLKFMFRKEIRTTLL